MVEYYVELEVYNVFSEGVGNQDEVERILHSSYLDDILSVNLQCV